MSLIYYVHYYNYVYYCSPLTALTSTYHHYHHYQATCVAEELAKCARKQLEVLHRR